MARRGRPKKNSSAEVEGILQERRSSYGDFTKVASITEGMRGAAMEGANWSNLDDQTKVALFFIMNKIARVVEGTLTKDSIRDIQGYAELILTHSTNIKG